MKCLPCSTRLFALALVLPLVSGCADENPVGPELATASEAWSASRGSATALASAAGPFTVQLTGLPVAEPLGANCRLTAPVQLDLSGDLVGAATGEITVLIFASCTDAVTNPPGTFRDRFRATTTFEGTLFGSGERAHLAYVGRTAVGGEVRGRFLVRGSSHGVLKVTATAGAGGSYSGVLLPNP